MLVDDILERMMDSSTASDSKNLIGHSGPVYAVCFSHDRHYILSSSEDGTGIVCLLFIVYVEITSIYSTSWAAT